MNDYLKPQKYQLAYQDNNLIRTALKMSLLQLRIFKLALSELNTTMTVFPTTTIPASTFISWLSNGESYDVLHRAVSGLAYKVLDLVPANQRSGHTHKIPIMAEVEFVSGEGVIRVTFNQKAAPYLLQLQGNYTITDIEVALRFKNTNAARLYDILHSYAGKSKGDFHEEIISLDDLKLWMLETTAVYPIFTEFNRRVLEPIAAEFKAIGYNATWKPYKTGKKTTAIAFKIPRERHRLATSESEPKPAAAEAAPVMRVNKDAAAPLAQAIKAATTQLASPLPAAATPLAQRVVHRLDILKLTQAQIKKVLDMLENKEESLTKLMKETHPIFCDFRDGRIKHDEVAGKTVNKLKSLFPAVNKAWSKE